LSVSLLLSDDICLEEWVSCPDGYDNKIDVVAHSGDRGGIKCYGHGRKIEEPVESSEPNHRLL